MAKIRIRQGYIWSRQGNNQHGYSEGILGTGSAGAVLRMSGDTRNSWLLTKKFIWLPGSGAYGPAAWNRLGWGLL